jgi:hypothetical protein
MESTNRTSLSGLSQLLAVAAVVAVVGIFGIQYGGPLLANWRDMLKPATTQINGSELPRPSLPAPGSIRGGTGYARPAVQQQMEAQAQERPQAAPQQPQSAPVIDVQSLPANSAGQPVISAQQAEQLNQAADLASREWQAAADAAALAFQQAQEEAAKAAQVKLDKEQAEAMLTNGRDLCSLPRANPRTCALGIPQATPLNAQP